METHVANLNNAVSSGPKPSIFEVAAEESLNTSLHPAFKYILKVISLRFGHIAVVQKLYQFSDEVFAVFKGLVEAHYLFRRDSTFSEHFYGLARTNIGSQGSSPYSTAESDSRRPNGKKKLCSLLSTVALPYILAKLEAAYNGTLDDTSDIASTLDRGSDEPVIKRLITKVCNLLSRFFHGITKAYPVLYTAIETIKLLFYIMYILTGLQSHSIIFAILGLKLEYRGPDQPTEREHEINLDKGNLLSYLAENVVVLLESVLPAAVFFLKFLEWWYEEGMDMKGHSFNVLPTPPPPMKPEVRTSDAVLSHASCCSLCGKVHQNPTALAISGFVFCYKCIYMYVTDMKRCPITYAPCTSDDLVRLYND